MTKHLFRIEFTDPTTPSEERLVKRTQSFRETDEALAPYVDGVHVLDMPYCEVTWYGRDLITEWGNNLFVDPKLLSGFPFKKSAFKRMMDALGYSKRIVPAPLLSEGGFYVSGEEFVFILNAFEDVLGISEKFFKTMLKKQPHFIPALSSLNGHIDLDYQIIDTLRLIYASSNAFKDDECRQKLEEIAEIHGFDVREYPVEKPMLDRKKVSEESAGKHSVVMWRYDSTDSLSEKIIAPGVDWDLVDEMLLGPKKGINSIINDNVFLTNYINPKEKEYLEKRGLKVVVVPLGDVTPGAGLRCVYGEFTI